MNNATDIEKIKNIHGLIIKKDLNILIANTFNILLPFKDEIEKISISLTYDYNQNDIHDGDYEEEEDDYYSNEYNDATFESSKVSVIGQKREMNELSEQINAFIQNSQSSSMEDIGSFECHITRKPNESGTDFLTRFVNQFYMSDYVKNSFAHAIDKNIPVPVLNNVHYNSFKPHSILGYSNSRIKKEVSLILIKEFIDFIEDTHQLLQKSDSIFKVKFTESDYMVQLLEDKPYDSFSLYHLKQCEHNKPKSLINEDVDSLLKMFNIHSQLLKIHLDEFKIKSFDINKSESIHLFRERMNDHLKFLGKDLYLSIIANKEKNILKNIVFENKNIPNVKHRRI